MIRPVCFGFNEQTAVSNVFQVFKPDQSRIQDEALKEFDNFVDLLRINEIDVLVIEDTIDSHTPDSIFPNNWISTHKDGKLVLYPMEAQNRRLERRPDIIHELNQHFIINEIIDLTFYEDQNKFLEATGSMVLDSENKLTYACLSSRTNQEVLADFCQRTGYQVIAFNASDKSGTPVYHTNVMMCVAQNFVIICLEAITDINEREQVINSFTQTGKEIIDISFKQMHCFAGNMLELKNKSENRLLIMSDSAYHSLNRNQITNIERYCEILHTPINTIETTGGGSARCMIAEINLPLKPILSAYL
jgi:hypothetical protein